MNKSFWERMQHILEPDEQIIFPEMYENNRRLYGDIRDSGWIVMRDDGTLDWVKENSITGTYLREGISAILRQIYIVQIRLPWGQTNGEIILSPEEFQNHRHRYQVMDVYLRVRQKSNGKIILMINPVEFEMFPDKYDLLEVRYLVAPKKPGKPGSMSNPFNINKDSIGRMVSH